MLSSLRSPAAQFRLLLLPPPSPTTTIRHDCQSLYHPTPSCTGGAIVDSVHPMINPMLSMSTSQLWYGSELTNKHLDAPIPT
ncbi:hypothetical protein L596_025513 [Steinernema carpocapsae]|uniref:Uncharacterized protein n=1 Tax=Steinernema carpocapsae TaxID=34508 RepID=A0A4U5M7Z7_STECR|nr:hypothetical protein L596_025513 [Steinernema carpocapsae]